MTPGQQLAAKRRIVTHLCAWPACGNEFTAIVTAKYCCNACAQKAKRERAKNAGISIP